jgi:hypothetical protein
MVCLTFAVSASRQPGSTDSVSQAPDHACAILEYIAAQIDRLRTGSGTAVSGGDCPLDHGRAGSPSTETMGVC